MKLKKVLCVAMAALTAFGAAACGGNTTGNTGADTGSVTTDGTET